jgi:hypothetical protein
MAFNQFPSKGGIPSGNTAGRPSNPAIGDTYYNGEVEALEIYNGTDWKVIKTEGFPPGTPTITSVTDSSTSLAYSSTAGTLTVVFEPAGTGGTATQFNAFTTAGGHSGFTTVGETVIITGLTPGTAYTVYGNAQNGSGTSTNTANASPVTPTTLPEAPTIGTATASSGAVTLTFTAGNSGGKTISNYKYSSDGTTYTAFSPAQTTSPLSITGLTNGTAYTFRIKAVNANGDGAASSAYDSVTPVAPTVTGGTLVTSGGFNYRIFTSNGTLGITNGPLIADVLAVGGAGGGGFGGGGAGALVYSPAISIASSTSVTIGSGGAGNESGSTTVKGNNTSLSTIVVAAGGGGAGRKTGDTAGNNNTGPGEAGGCGGGSGHPDTGIPGTGGAASSGLSTGTNIYGNNGGDGYNCCNGGGGGGTGLAGGNADGDPGTGVNIGGDGKTNWLNASTSDTAAFLWAAQIGTNGSNALVSSLGSNPGTIYLGGGGGGAYGSPRGGYGGGGTGGVSGGNTSGITAGAANTGSGGGGGNGSGKAGGSGVLIVRWGA